LKPFRVRFEDLRWPPNVPAGMNVLELMAYAYEAKATTEDQDPIEVEALPDGSFRLTDGRHRALACLIAGRPDVLAVLQGS
jgi:hypothetical protein